MCVVRDRFGFFEKTFLFKNWGQRPKMGQKQGFFEFM